LGTMQGFAGEFLRGCLVRWLRPAGGSSAGGRISHGGRCGSLLSQRHLKWCAYCSRKGWPCRVAQQYKMNAQAGQASEK
jgi:hypothetical protein